MSDKFGTWIPCSDRPPKDLETVIVTWINRAPAPYYRDIKDKTFTDSAYRYNGQWYWWSSVGQDYVKEYGYYEPDRVDEYIDIVAWMPMPEPYKEG